MARLVFAVCYIGYGVMIGVLLARLWVGPQGFWGPQAVPLVSSVSWNGVAVPWTVSPVVSVSIPADEDYQPLMVDALGRLTPVKEFPPMWVDGQRIK